jgi:arabinofuranosyltransferase
MTGDPQPEEARGRPSLFEWLQGDGLLLAPALLLVILGFSQRWVAEDAFIGLRVVRNFLDGHGPVFNLGERVEVYSDPLWLGLEALVDGALRLATGRSQFEWTAVVLGLLFSGGGLALATLGARRLWRGEGATEEFLPLGALVVAAIPPFWDFATSGLETGFIFGWLGASFYLLTLELSRRRAAPRLWVVFLFGLGPLIRPDLAIESGCFLLAELRLFRPWSWRSAWRVVAAAGALPVAYQVFRMGYFGALVSNSALAKEAGLSDWPQGWIYLRDFGGTYLLWIPAAGLLWAWASDLRGLRGRKRVDALVVLAAPVVGALVQSLYVIRLGGDFMHGRMLLPCVFAAALPYCAVAGRRRWGVAALLAWAAICAFELRPSYPPSFGANGKVLPIGPPWIRDERAFYVEAAKTPHPITLDDYGAWEWAQDGRRLRQWIDLQLPGHRATLNETLYSAPVDVAVIPSLTAKVIAPRFNVGIVGFAAGPEVWFEDTHGGVASPLTARVRLQARSRPGHEKALIQEWMVARLFDATAPGALKSAEIDDAAAALGCGDLAELRRAIEDPLTVGRFLRNLAAAPRLTRLRIPADPAAARRELCGQAPAASP